MSYLFVIVGKNDNPLYKTEHSVNRTEVGKHFHEFILHSSLDVVDELLWKNTAMYFKNIDRFGDSTISAFVTAGSMLFYIVSFILICKNNNHIKQILDSCYYMIFEMKTESKIFLWKCMNCI